jgi:hypothetical protein
MAAPLCVALMDPCTPGERAVLLGWLFALGKIMTARDVADLLGIKDRRARSLLNEASRIIPIYRDDDGLWRVCNGNACAAVKSIMASEQQEVNHVR